MTPPSPPTRDRAALLPEADLNANERSALRRVCRLNGHGWYTGAMTEKQLAAITGLHERGLVQGKKGMPHSVVHTREGWSLWKTMRVQ
jgi:hypothetical protein